MNPTPTLSAKDRVIQWVRSKNPQTITERYVEGCQKYSAICGKKSEKGTWYCETCKEWNGEDRYVQDFADMGISELLIALCSLGAHSKMGDWQIRGTIEGVLAFYGGGGEGLFNYYLPQNLNDQTETLYEALLSLIPNA